MERKKENLGLYRKNKYIPINFDSKKQEKFFPHRRKKSTPKEQKKTVILKNTLFKI